LCCIIFSLKNLNTILPPRFNNTFGWWEADGIPTDPYDDAWTLTKTDPPVLKKIDPGSAQLFVSFENDKKFWFSMHSQRRFSGMP